MPKVIDRRAGRVMHIGNIKKVPKKKLKVYHEDKLDSKKEGE